MSDQENDYEIGYGKPPKSGQFKKGQSGNAKGRPKASKSVGILVQDVFLQKISIKENGKQKHVTMLEALLRQLITGALKGEMRSIDRVFKLLPILQETLEQEKMDALAGSSNGDVAGDLVTLQVLADMFGSDPDELFATIQGGIDDECPEF